MGLFSKSQVDLINSIAKKSHDIQAPKPPSKKASSINSELNASTEAVLEYFKDSPAILIEDKEQLHQYVTDCIQAGYCGIDTETTGLDRNLDYIVGASLYYPEGIECYIPMKHRVPIFEDEYKGQLSYQDVAEEFQRFVDEGCKLIFANANFDLYMIWKDLKVDLNKAFFYDVILAWRCLKEDELHNGLKELYNKYVLGGEGDPKRFSDFFSPELFPYCKPNVAKLYAANDAKITYELFRWQLPYTIKNSNKCQANKLEHVADLIWNLEFPLVPIIQDIERTGMYIDQDTASVLQEAYHKVYDAELATLKGMVNEAIEKYGMPATDKRIPFHSGKDFNPRSTLHVKFLLYTLMKLPKPDGKEGTGVGVLSEFNLPITNKIVEVRSLATNISTFIDKLPNAVAKDGKIHANFKQIGAGTGRMSCIAEGTLISTEDGFKEIQELTLGDRVYCYSDNGNLEISDVIGVYFTGIRRCIKINISHRLNGYKGSLICTPDHFIKCYQNDEFIWKQAKDLEPSDYVVSLLEVECDYFADTCVEAIELLEELYPVYDITVKDHHNFIASTICVHNSSDPNLQNIPSKLDDVRHMFRADPETYEIIKVKDDIEFTLKFKSYDSLPTPEGYVSLKKLKQGCIVEFNNGSVKKKISNISVNGRFTFVSFKD